MPCLQRVFEQHAQILEAGELGDAVALDQVPEQHHEGAVGDGEVGAQQGIAIAKIVGQVLERRGRWNHDQAAVLANLVDRLLGIGHDEAYSKDALEMDRSVDGLFSLCKVFGGMAPENRRRAYLTATPVSICSSIHVMVLAMPSRRRMDGSQPRYFWISVLSLLRPLTPLGASSL